MLAAKEHCRKSHKTYTIDGNICTNIGRTHLSIPEQDALGPFCSKWRGIDISSRQLISY